MKTLVSTTILGFVFISFLPDKALDPADNTPETAYSKITSFTANDKPEIYTKSSPFVEDIARLKGTWMVFESRKEKQATSISASKLFYPAAPQTLKDFSVVKFEDNTASLFESPDSSIPLYTFQFSNYKVGTLNVGGMMVFNLGPEATSLIGNTSRVATVLLEEDNVLQLTQKRTRVQYFLRKVTR